MAQDLFKLGVESAFLKLLEGRVARGLSTFGCNATMRNRAVCVWSCFLPVIAWLLVGVVAAAEAVPVGKSDFVFVDERGNADKPIRRSRL